MLNSLVLENYSPILIPISFIYGINLSELGYLCGDFSFIGIFILSMSLLIYYDRIEEKKNETLPAGLFLFVLAYILSLKNINKFIVGAILLASFVMIGEDVTAKNDVYDPSDQYVYFSLVVMFFVFIFLFPGDRINSSPQSLSLILVGISITILTLTTIKTP
jgi:hypothetical protein